MGLMSSCHSTHRSPIRTLEVTPSTYGVRASGVLVMDIMELDPTIRPSRWQQLATWAWPGHPTRWRDLPGRLRPTLSSVFRLTAAAVVSYLITLVLTEGAIDLTGA